MLATLGVLGGASGTGGTIESGTWPGWYAAVIQLVGGSLVFLSGTAVLFGAYPDLSTIGVAAAMPVLAWELSLALWMIVKGFRTVTPDQTPTSVLPTAPIAA